MKRVLEIAGLDCGNCALTLEKYLQKIDGVISCNINFSLGKLYLEIEDVNYKAILKNIYKTTKQVNPSVKLLEGKKDDKNMGIVDIILYIIGLILGCVVIFVNLNNVWFYSLLILSALFMGFRTYYKAILQLGHLKINENTLITLSIIGAIAIGESIEGLMVIALYTLGKFLESRAINYSRKSITTLIEMQPEYAIVIDGKKEKKVKPEQVEIGQLIIVKPGEKVALDGIVVEGKASIDKSHLTGESIPQVVDKDTQILSGSIVLDSTIVIKVSSVYKDSAVSKIFDLVSNASNKKSKTETIISKFSSFYTLGVIIASIVVFLITFFVIKNINVAIYRSLIFLVVSCPCAFAISVPLTYFSGIGKSSKQGILIKGSNFIDACAKLNKIIFDKTGTITTGKFEVTRVDAFGNYTKNKLLELVVAGEKNSLHPIAKAICEFYGKESKLKVSKFKEVAGVGIKFVCGGKNYSIGKEHSNIGRTNIAVYEEGVVIGNIRLQDKVKSEAKDSIFDLAQLGLKTMMLTGDNSGVAKKISKQLSIDEYKAELLPVDKFNIIHDIKQKENIGFVGDGLNDAPALTISDVGISMGIMGSPATIEASDVVIADDNLKQIPKLIKISRKTRSIAWGNIIFAGITKFIFLLLGSFGVTGMLFAVIADVGVTLIAILNSLRVLAYRV